MSEKSNIATVPADIRQALLCDDTAVQTQVGHVAKFNHDGASNTVDENMESIDNYKKPKEANEFVGLTKEELKAYINNPKWKRIRWVIAILYILILVLLLTGSVLLVIFSQKCPPRQKLVWYQKEIIYEVDVSTFKDSDQDGIGDLKGVFEKIQYFEQNKIKSILLLPSIFNSSGGTSEKLPGQYTHTKNVDLLDLDPKIGTDNDFQELFKALARRDMHLIIDLPLSSKFDPNSYSWYKSTSSLSNRNKNPCSNISDRLAYVYCTSYDRPPLDFSNSNISEQAENHLRHWLLTKKLDGVRVDLPLFINESTGLYQISYSTIAKWIEIKKTIEANTRTKLLLFDIPFTLQNLTINANLSTNMAHSLLLLNNRQTITIDASILDKRMQLFKKNSSYKPQFWQLGSHRSSDKNAIIEDRQLPKEMLFTLTMLLGGTPVVLYGEEIGLNQTTFPFMSWAPDQPHGRYSSCKSGSECSDRILKYQKSLPKTSVKRQEASGGGGKDSLLAVFRHLSGLRLKESFQFGALKTSYDEPTNIFWFIREAPGHKGYVVVLNLNKEASDLAHISLHQLTGEDVPLHIHYDYQWPKAHLAASNKTHIDSDNLLIHPQSINIFWWSARLMKTNVVS